VSEDDYGLGLRVHEDAYRELERERDEWKATQRENVQLKREVDRERALANEAIATWRKTKEERDEARDQRDRLAEACDQYSEDEILCKLQTVTAQRDEARDYADRLAEGLPEGMLPKDVEVLREANLGLATELSAVTEQRDRLAEALQKVVTAWDDAEWLDENDFEAFRATLQSLTPKP
jgi:kynureninase